MATVSPSVKRLIDWCALRNDIPCSTSTRATLTGCSISRGVSLTLTMGESDRSWAFPGVPPRRPSASLNEDGVDMVYFIRQLEELSPNRIEARAAYPSRP